MEKCSVSLKMNKVKKGDIKLKQFSVKEEVMSGFPIIHQLYDKMDKKSYEAHIDEMMEGNNYFMVGAFLDDQLIGVASYWILTRFYCGRYVQIGNMVVDKKLRGFGVGRKLLRFVEEEGKKKGCKKFILDSYTENKKSHNLYFREGFFVEGFHFMKNI